MTLDDLLSKWLGREGGAERANYQMFLSEFAQAMDLPRPNPKGMGLGEYEFEAPVRSEAVFSGKGTKRIDLYKRDCFILEAKQSQLKPGEAAEPEPAQAPLRPVFDLFGHAVGYEAPGRSLPRYDRLMADAKLQAERYALALPGDHRAPPFLIVADIGRSFELYFDWAGNGRGYAPLPDERGYRVPLEDLRDPAIAARFRGIWTDPASIDPRLKAAAVTRDVAFRLSRVAAQLEKDQRDHRPGDAEVSLGIEATSLFLMRMLFCMFAEDVELLPPDSFKRFLAEAVDKSPLFWRNGLADLWSKMNMPDEANRFWLAGDAIVRYFNGNLFGGARIYDLPTEFKNELLVAAGKDWRAVEPAIFGTLLEQVLTPRDRAKLGAHYTPRAYVERLVEATMMEVLRPEWEAVRERARLLLDPPRHGEGDRPRASEDGGGAGPNTTPAGPSTIAQGGNGPPPQAKLGEDKEKLHLTLAIADHPWTRVGKDAAAVRIAMTVAARGDGTGRLVTITGERALDSDAPELEEREAVGTIHADLSIGTNVTRVAALRANEGLCSPGVKLHGAGFIVSPEKARALGLGTRPGLEAHVRDYRNGRDLLQRPRGAMVIDLFGLSENEVMDRFPEVYQHVLTTVREGRAEQVKRSATADAKAYLANWWIFGKPRTELRPALAGLPCYIATTETSKHRVFQFVEGSVLADNMLVVLASDDPFHLGVLSSRLHTEWVLQRGGWLGFGNDNRYSKSLVFDPFPFPDPAEPERLAVAALAERLDATRRTALAEDAALTMTGLYNLVAEVRAGAPLPPAREAAVVRARARIVAKLHDDLDDAVAAAYGWETGLAPAEIVARLVALNAARAGEEAAGQVRWLRPDYQRPRFGRAGDPEEPDKGAAA